MFERLQALHVAGRLSPAQLATAVTRGWITGQQADEITGGGPPDLLPPVVETAP